MIKYEDFEKALQNIESYDKIEVEVTKAFKLLSDDFNFFSLGYVALNYIDLLKLVMEDSDDDSWIDYYIYETKFGKEDRKIKVKGKEFLLKTPEQLYELLTKK